MKNWRKGKLGVKALSILVALSLVCIPVSAADAEDEASGGITLKSEVTVSDVELTVQCGAAYANKKVMVQVFEPAGSIEDLKSASGKYDVTDVEKIDKALCCVYYGIANASGDMTFKFTPMGEKGKYTVRVTGEGMSAPTELVFEFLTTEDKTAILSEIVLTPTKDAVAEMFAKADNENIYKPYQILELDKSEYYADFESMSDSVKAEVYEYIAAGIAADAAIDPAGLLKLYEKAVMVEYLNAATGEGLKAYIDKHVEELGFKDTKGYTKIYNDSDRLSDKVKTEFLKAVAAADISGKDVSEISAVLEDAALISLLSYTDSPGVIEAVIGEFEDEILAAGADIDAFKDAATLSVCRDVIDAQPFESLEDFAEELNAVIPDGNGGSSGGSGGGGGGSSSSGSKVSYSFSDVAPVIPDVPNASSYVFNDIATVVWAHEAITVLHEKGIISGRPDGSFAPDAAVTREEFVKMLVAALGFETSGAAADFADVSGNEWFAPYVYTAYNNGIVSGMGDGFGVGRNISRQDMAVMCANALKVKGAELKAVKAESKFADNISDYAKEAVEKLYSAGLINGLSDTEFGATGTTTRAQAAKLLYEVTKAIS